MISQSKVDRLIVSILEEEAQRRVETYKRSKLLIGDFDLFGVQFGIPLCCLIFFNNCWDDIRMDVPEYASTMSVITDNAGVILCPKCLVKTLKANKQQCRQDLLTKTIGEINCSCAG